MARAIIARFLNYFPQYTLDDIRTGRLSAAEFAYLNTGMLDCEFPGETEPVAVAIRRKVEEAHANAKGKRGGW